MNHDQDQGQGQGQGQDEGDAADENVKKAERQYLLATLRHDREREWKIYDEKRDSLRVIRAYVLATAPAKWVTYDDDGVVGGGSYKDVRRLLVELRERVADVRAARALRWQRVRVQELQRQQELQQRGAGASAGAGAGIVGTGAGAVGVSAGAGTANVRVGSGAGAEAGAATGTGTVNVGAGASAAAGNATVVTQGNYGYPSQEVWGGYVFPAQGYWG